MTIPAGWGALGFTSGRRTYLGNKRVGGVEHSHHLDGTAADFTAPLSVLQARFPGHPILQEGDHRHVGGLSDVPYYGVNGTKGLVNGVDTSAPKGATMLQPRKPQGPNFAAMSMLSNGIDPLAPQPEAMPQMAAAPQPLMPQPPQQPTMLNPRKPHLNAGAIMGILGDALAAYGGQRGVFAPMMAQQRENEAEDNRFQQQLAAQQGMALYKAQLAATTPPKPTQTDRYVQEVLDPHTPAPRRQLLMQILTRPLMTVGSDGSQTAQYGAAPNQGGDDEWEYNN